MYKFIGECSHCGDCCKPVHQKMKKLGGTHCDFLIANICSMRTNMPAYTPTEEQSDWHDKECIPFPDANRKAHIPPRFNINKVFPRCTYKLVKE
jgi:hypothetical protein